MYIINKQNITSWINYSWCECDVTVHPTTYLDMLVKLGIVLFVFFFNQWKRGWMIYMTVLEIKNFYENNPYFIAMDR